MILEMIKKTAWQRWQHFDLAASYSPFDAMRPLSLPLPLQICPALSFISNVMYTFQLMQNICITYKHIVMISSFEISDS